MTLSPSLCLTNFFSLFLFFHFLPLQFLSVFLCRLLTFCICFNLAPSSPPILSTLPSLSTISFPFLSIFVSFSFIFYSFLSVFSFFFSFQPLDQNISLSLSLFIHLSLPFFSPLCLFLSASWLPFGSFHPPCHLSRCIC